MAASQLKLKSSSDINFTDYKIKNWPEFVSVSYRKWIPETIKLTRKAVPDLQFIRKQQDTAESRSKNKESCNVLTDRIGKRRKLLNRLVQKFQDQVSSIRKKVLWSSIHITGWPVGIHLRADRWNVHQVFEISKAFDHIKFSLIKPGEKPTVTFSDGSKVELKDKKKEEHCDEEEEEEHDEDQ